MSVARFALVALSLALLAGCGPAEITGPIRTVATTTQPAPPSPAPLPSSQPPTSTPPAEPPVIIYDNDGGDDHHGESRFCRKRRWC